MTIGKTHSGKTTFGRELAQRIEPCCLLDFDEVAEFLKDKYPNLYSHDYQEGTYELTSGYHLKIAVMLEVYKFALKTDLPIVFTSANATKQIRQEISRLAKESGRTTILVYFNFSDKILLKRIKSGQRFGDDKNKINIFVNFLTNIQNRRFEIPNQAEADYYFEVNEDIISQQVIERILALPIN
jgi:predicted kinase